MICAAIQAMAEGRAATKTRRMMPQVTTAGPDCHRMPSTGGTFLSASIRSRQALREDCGLVSVMKFDSLGGPDPSGGSVIGFLTNVTNQMHFPVGLLAE